MRLQDNILSNVMEDEHSFVELVATMPEKSSGDNINMDTFIVNGARTSYLGYSKGEEADKKLLKYLMDNHHDSPFEQPQATFRIRAPKMCIIQILRHRAFHFNSESGRYSEVKDEVYIPDKWRLQDVNNKQASNGVLNAEDNEAWRSAMDSHYKYCYHLYKQALQDGIAKELARGFLPSDFMYVTIVLTGDLRNLLHFFELRCDGHAQWETQRIACAMCYLLHPHMPWTAELWTAKQNDSVLENIVKFASEVGHA